jgi:hypothetical protein
MTLMEQVFAVIGIASTVLLIIQVILLAVGFGGEADGDAGGGGADAHFDGPDVDFDGADVDFDGGAPDLDIGGDVGDISAGAGDWYGHLPDADLSRMAAPEADTFDGGAGTGIHLFTLQGVIAFFAVFGWSGLIMLKSGLPAAAGMGIGIVLGFAAMLVIALIFRGMMRLQQDGSMDIRNALGKSGTVYMRVPAARTQKGKVSIIIQEQLMELDAVTDEADSIPTGSEVTVIGISNGNALIVRKK